MTDLLDIIAGHLQRGEDLVLARVISIKGSSPRHLGAAMIIRRNGGIEGTVGGGLIEAAAMRKAVDLFREKGFARLWFDMTGDDVTVADMVCGGKCELLIEYMPADSNTSEVFDRLLAGRRRNHKSYMITSLPVADEGSGPLEHIVLAPGSTCATGSDGSAGLTARLTDTVWGLNEPALVDIEGHQFWVDIVLNTGVLYIFGAGHISREVNDLAARVGFVTVVLDDRTEYANRERFALPAEIIVLKSFDDCYDGLQLDDDSYVVIVTRGHAYDKTVLAQTLHTKAGYIGMIGSNRKRDAIYKTLLAEGFTAEQLEKVHCPIGLKIETETPAEIAVSIVGELIEKRAQKRKWKGQASRP
ncbi:MAG: XdhC family protein [Dehalococcoidia bacterium]|nr:XdhC family protein [Dehalococcoidia bacterium]